MFNVGESCVISSQDATEFQHQQDPLGGVARVKEKNSVAMVGLA